MFMHIAPNYLACLSFSRALNDKEEIQHQFETLVSTVNHIHHMVIGPETDSVHGGAIRVDENHKHLPTKEILQRLTSVSGGIQVMKRQQQELNK